MRRSVSTFGWGMPPPLVLVPPRPSLLIGQRLEPGQVLAGGGDDLVPDPGVEEAADRPPGYPIVHVQAQGPDNR